jgi:hypothetical protein
MSVIVLSGYTAYFDRSANGHDLVAGFVSSVEQWTAFEHRWNAALADFRVPYFHRNEILNGKPPYHAPQWRDKPYQEAFFVRLVKIIIEWTEHSIGCGVDPAVFRAANQGWELGARFNEYALCGRDCAVRVRNIIRQRNSNLPITYIFDRGDKGWGMLCKEMRNCGFAQPTQRKSRPSGKDDIDNPPAVPLQACDFLAWELRRGAKDQSVGKELRRSLNALRDPNRCSWFQYRPHDLSELCRVAGIPPRIQGASTP